MSSFAPGTVDQCAGKALFVCFARRGQVLKAFEIALLRLRVHARVFAGGVKF